MGGGSCTFQDRWLTDSRFQSWLKRHSDKTRAVCKVCKNKDFSIEKMGVSALISHMGGKMHASYMKDVNPLQSLFFKPKPKDSEKSDSSSKSKENNTKTSEGDLSVKVLDSEIRWAIKVVKMHASYRSCLDISKLFASMFTDSEIAASFQMSKTKVSYIIGFGLADYFYKTLASRVKQSPFYAILFDESLNDTLMKEQMDSKYKEYLKKNKLEKQKTREDEKVEELLSEIQTLNRKQLTISQTIATLQKDANDCYDKAEEYNDDLQKMQNEVSKGNSLRQTIGQKRKLEKQYQKDVKSLHEQIEAIKKARK